MVSAARSTGSSSLPAGIIVGWATPVLSPAYADDPRDTIDRTSTRDERRPNLVTSASPHTRTRRERDDAAGTSSGLHGTSAPPLQEPHQAREQHPGPTQRPHPPSQPTHQSQDVPRQKRQGKTTRGTLKIATQNIRGAAGGSTKHKWTALNHRIKTDTIGVLALQETHLLTDQRVNELNSIHGFRMQIFHSGDPERPNAAGVAIILNKSTTRWKEATASEIVPGRALMVSLPWKDQSSLNILSVYAPNSTSENTAFWKTLYDKWENEDLPRPDVMLGDFNMTEEAIDREPQINWSRSSANENLDTLKEQFGLADAWRINNPDTLEYTWVQPNSAEVKSRLDRVYLMDSL